MWKKIESLSFLYQFLFLQGSPRERYLGVDEHGFPSGSKSQVDHPEFFGHRTTLSFAERRESGSRHEDAGNAQKFTHW